MKLHILACAATLLAATGCHPQRPVVDTGTRPPAVGGTIAGSVRETGAGAPLSGRKVSAIDEGSGRRYETSTGSNGGYTLQVPQGKYRLEVELRQGESLEMRPDPTDVGVGDIDSARDFVLTVRR
jgi:hypothetical protein